MGFVLPAAIIAGASLAGGIANFLANKSAADRAEMLQDRAMQEWLKIAIPDPAQQKLALEQFVVQGVLNPRLEASIKADPSAFEKIVVGADHKAAQNRALAELENIGLSGGLRLQDKAALQEAQGESQVQARAARDNIAAESARRGTGGSGFDIAAKLHGQQTEADRNARNSLQVAAGAQDRSLQALLGAGDLATRYRGQEFGEKAAKAAASDRINLFNTQNMQDVQSRNVGSLNRAQEMNLGQKQRTADQNVGLKNYEQEYNKKLPQQRFENEAAVAAGKTGQYNKAADSAIQSGKNEGNFYSNIAGAGANTAASVAQYNLMDEYLKKKSPQDELLMDKYLKKKKD